jgi:bacillithiol biosynthesis deacetylase BshB1
MMNKPLDILAFSPHPDDAELGCGGSLILATDRGLDVSVADLSEGEMSSRGTPTQRGAEKQEAAELLGLRARLLVGLPDTEIGTDPAHRAAVIQLIRETRPRVVLAPFGEDRHPDHAATGKLVREACFLAGVHKVSAGSPHRPERVYYYMIHQPFTPSFVVDISKVWERKMAAVQAYKTQFQTDASGPETAISRSDFLRFIEARAIWFGTMIGAAYGEAFFTPGPVPQAQLPGLTDSPPPSNEELPTYRPY